MTKKIKVRCMIISENEWKRLPHDLSKKFDVSKKDNFNCYIGCMSPYLISKTQKILSKFIDRNKGN